MKKNTKLDEKDAKITIRISQSEKNYYTQIADNLSISTSDYIRSKLRNNSSSPIADIQELLDEVGDLRRAIRANGSAIYQAYRARDITDVELDNYNKTSALIEELEYKIARCLGL